MFGGKGVQKRGAENVIVLYSNSFKAPKVGHKRRNGF